MVTPEQESMLLAQVDAACIAAPTADAATLAAMRLIQAKLTHYNWVGVYWMDGPDTLVLGPYVGAETEHTTIPVGRGVCGTAVAENRNQVIDDVRALDNYLACSIETRSEIVVLIRDDAGNILGQIDADGHETAAFDATDAALLEKIAEKLAARVAEESR